MRGRINQGNKQRWLVFKLWAWRAVCCFPSFSVPTSPGLRSSVSFNTNETHARCVSVPDVESKLYNQAAGIAKRIKLGLQHYRLYHRPPCFQMSSDSGSSSRSNSPSPSGTRSPSCNMDQRLMLTKLWPESNVMEVQADPASKESPTPNRESQPQASLVKTNAGGDVTSSKQREVGPGVYIKFEGQAVNLDVELRKLCNNARKIGSSAGIVSASTRLRERLKRILYAFQENAKILYPRKIGAHMLKVPSPLESDPGKTDTTIEYHKQLLRTIPGDSKSVPKVLAEEFRVFSGDVKNLLDCFGQFPVFVDELPDLSVVHNLEEFADLLRDYEEDSESDTLVMRHFLDNVMGDMGDYLGNLAECFVTFTKNGIPTVKASQEHGISNLENQTVVATLFAGIATAMLQVYTNISPGTLNTIVIILWDMCLIFSIGSAVNGLLALSWTQAIYRSPDSHIPWSIRVWIKTFPLVFLVLAIACSFVAIILIGYLPDQSRATRIVTTVLSSILCLGLLAVSGWFVCEFLVFRHYKGKVWLVDMWKTSKKTSGYKKGQGASGSEEKYPPASGSHGVALASTLGHFHIRTHFWSGLDKTFMSRREIAKYRWRESIRRIIQERRTAENSSTSGLPLPYEHLTRVSVNSMRRKIYRNKLQSMKMVPIEPTAAHQRTGMTRSFAFSPDGTQLFASYPSLNHPLSCLRGVDESVPNELELQLGYFPQIDWSHDSKYLLVRSCRKLSVWQINGLEPGQQPKSIIEYQPQSDKDPEHEIRSATWTGPNGSATEFVFVEGKKLMAVRMAGLDIARCEGPKTLDSGDLKELDFDIHHLEIRGSTCVTSDSRWMICPVKYHKEGENEEKAVQKYGISVLDLVNHKLARLSSIYHKTSDVALASDGASILVSYENRSPSQCWRLYIRKDGAHLSVHQSYYVSGIEFSALPSLFGGEDDHLVLRVAQAGDVYAWVRDSAELIGCIKTPEVQGKELTTFAWNRGLKSLYMFAIGTHDGGVYIWKQEEVKSDERAKIVQSESSVTASVPGDQAITSQSSKSGGSQASTLRGSGSIDTYSSGHILNSSEAWGE